VEVGRDEKPKGWLNKKNKTSTTVDEHKRY
jgi:hypothetical protein